MYLIEEETGRHLKIGDKVKTFRGTYCTLVGISKPKHPTSTGRVYLRIAGIGEEYFPAVIGAKFVDPDYEDEPYDHRYEAAENEIV